MYLMYKVGRDIRGRLPVANAAKHGFTKEWKQIVISGGTLLKFLFRLFAESLLIIFNKSHFAID